MTTTELFRLKVVVAFCGTAICCFSGFAASMSNSPSTSSAVSMAPVAASGYQGSVTQIRGPVSQTGIAASPPLTANSSSFLDSKFVSSSIGLIGGAVGFLLSRWIAERTKKREEDEQYCCLLVSAANELEFYAEKFTFLSSQLAQYLAGTGVIPSYQFYPAFLEQIKIRISGLMRDADVLKEIGHCHFELSHICERMAIFKKQCDDPAPLAPMITKNTRGFKELVDSNIPVFQKIAAVLRDQAKTTLAKWH
jgi:hypothetical protein